MSAIKLSVTSRYFMGRLWHQQRDITRRRPGLPVLVTQTWVYRGDGDGEAEFPARYGYEARPVWTPAGRTDAELFAIWTDLSVPDGSPLLNAVAAERYRRLYQRRAVPASDCACETCAAPGMLSLAVNDPDPR